MATNNYFKVEREPFFFNDRDAASAARAFDGARARRAALMTVDDVSGPTHVPRIAAWQRFTLRGAWDDYVVHVVGETPIEVPDDVVPAPTLDNGVLVDGQHRFEAAREAGDVPS